MRSRERERWRLKDTGEQGNYWRVPLGRKLAMQKGGKACRRNRMVEDTTKGTEAKHHQGLQLRLLQTTTVKSTKKT